MKMEQQSESEIMEIRVRAVTRYSVTIYDPKKGSFHMAELPRIDLAERVGLGLRHLYPDSKFTSLDEQEPTTLKNTPFPVLPRKEVSDEIDIQGKRARVFAVHDFGPLRRILDVVFYDETPAMKVLDREPYLPFSESSTGYMENTDDSLLNYSATEVTFVDQPVQFNDRIRVDGMAATVTHITQEDPVFRMLTVRFDNKQRFDTRVQEGHAGLYREHVERVNPPAA
jgi:hypothetical protein